MSRVADKPTLPDVLSAHKKDFLLSTNCHAIGIVNSFDPIRQTVSARIAYQRTISRPQANGSYLDTPTPYPVLVDCPVVVLKGGPAALTMPIEAGDTCLILFNDRDIDHWFATGQELPPNSTRLHAFTDAFALVGISHTLNALKDYDSTRAGIQYGKTRVAVGPTKVLITNSPLPTSSLGFILNTFMTACAGSSDPTLVAAAAAAKTQLALLLE